MRTLDTVEVSTVRIGTSGGRVGGERRYQPIEDYGIIGDLHTVALVGKDGSIDFLSYPALRLAHDLRRAARHGARRRVLHPPAPRGRDRASSCTSPTRTSSSRGSLGARRRRRGLGLHARRHRRRPTTRTPSCGGRSASGVRSSSTSCVDPRFDYGRAEPHGRAARRRRGDLRVRGRGRHRTCGCAPTCPSRSATTVHASAGSRSRAGETAALRARGGGCRASPARRRRPTSSPSRSRTTVNFWRTWIGRSTVPGPVARDRQPLRARAEAARVERRTGRSSPRRRSGCPRSIGGERNWDYRYTWIRDASFTLYALIRLGYTDGGRARSCDWIEDRCMDLNPDGSLQIMYGHDGRKILTEETLDHLEGYRGLVAGAHRQRRVRPAPARHLRRAHGLGVPLQQVRRADLARPVAEPRPARRLGDRALAAARRGRSGRCAAGARSSSTRG